MDSSDVDTNHPPLTVGNLIQSIPNLDADKMKLNYTVILTRPSYSLCDWNHT